jgi:hypothetical protein
MAAADAGRRVASADSQRLFLMLNFTIFFHFICTLGLRSLKVWSEEDSWMGGWALVRGLVAIKDCVGFSRRVVDWDRGEGRPFRVDRWAISLSAVCCGDLKRRKPN